MARTLVTSGQTSPIALRQVQENLQVIAYPWQQNAQEITEFIVSMSWEEDAQKAAIEMTMTLSDPQGISRKMLAPGTWVDILFSKTTADYNMRLYVWSRTMTDYGQATATITLLDISSFLQRQGQQNWLFKADQTHAFGWTAAQICDKVMSDLEIPHNVHGMVSKQKIKYLQLTQLTPFECIVKALTADRMLGGTRYTIRSAAGGIIIRPLVLQPIVWEVSEGHNLQSATWTETLDGKLTEMDIVHLDRKGNRTITRVLSNDIARYGRLRQVGYYKRIGVAKAQLDAATRLKRLKNLTRTATVTADGILGVRASDALVIKDSGTGLKGRFFVDKITHEISSSGYTMTIDLSYVVHIPAVTLAKDELHPQTVGTGPKASLTGAGPLMVCPLGPTSFKWGTGPGKGEHTGSAWQWASAYDMLAPAGTTVVAPITGSVVKIGASTTSKGDKMGANVTIQSKDKTLSVFLAHLTQLTVKVGDKTVLGETNIGEIDDRTDGDDSLHFAMYGGIWTGNNKKYWLDPKKQLLSQPDNTNVPPLDTDDPGATFPTVSGGFWGGITSAVSGKNPTPVGVAGGAAGALPTGPTAGKVNVDDLPSDTRTWSPAQRASFFAAVMQYLGYTPTRRGIAVMYAWVGSENTAAKFNPLATTQGEPGSTNLPGNPDGVQEYKSAADGVKATAVTFKTGGGDGYPSVLNAIRTGNPNVITDHDTLKWSNNGYTAAPIVARFPASLKEVPTGIYPDSA